MMLVLRNKTKHYDLDSSTLTVGSVNVARFTCWESKLPSYNFDFPQNKPMIPIPSMFNKWLLCPEEVKGRYFNVTNRTPNKATFFFTSNSFGVIEDVLDCERCEHHTYGFSWHTHLGTVWERPSTFFFFRKHTSNLHISTFTLRMIELWTNLT